MSKLIFCAWLMLLAYGQTSAECVGVGFYQPPKTNCQSLNDHPPKEVPCESYIQRTEQVAWDFYNLKTCQLWPTTVIDDPNYVLASKQDVEVRKLNLYMNAQISFLPLYVDVNFPNLLAYSAYGCNIKMLRKENFENLKKVKELLLNQNKIETIYSDVFLGLESVQFIFLDGNKIKQMNGQLFVQLHNLKRIWLDGNQCIKGYFSEGNIASLPSSVAAKCGFLEYLTNANIKCGNRENREETGDPHRILVINGAVSTPTEWPWLAALMRSKDKSFFCGGSIISQNHLLTAAHCLYYQSLRLGINDFFAYVGKYDLTSSNEGSKFYPSKIITHELYTNGYASGLAYDIGIIYSTSSIFLNQMTQIICLWSGQIGSEKISKSTAAGRGITETGRASNTPLKTDVEMTKCWDVDVFPINNEDRWICGKGVDSGKGSSGLCNGDSGSGLYVQANGNWFIRGIPSKVQSSINERCITTAPVIFTNVAAFNGWIEDTMYTTKNVCT